jgi:Spy/CpxP family protein refolding chaperone
MWKVTLLTLGILLGAALAAHTVLAQNPTMPPPPMHGGAADPPHHMLAQMCSTAFEKNISEGRGFGMAFVADQQGYPGPLHVLELKDRLKLTPTQEIQVQALLAAMFAESRPKSEQFLVIERKLRSLFVDGVPDEASVRRGITEVGRARSEVRMVHLLFHLRTRDLLDDEQRRIYQEVRWSRRE